MDKIAFLILAHTDKNQLKRLIKSLDYSNFDIYVHIDLKSSIILDDLVLKYSCLYIIKNRIDVEWGKISIVNATLVMYKEATKTFDYARYVTLSGLDYPLISNEIIYKTLIDSEKEFISGHLVTGKESLKFNLNFNCNHLLFKIKQRLISSDFFYFVYSTCHCKRDKKLILSGGGT